MLCIVLIIFFFNDTATTEIYTLSLHDALPIWAKSAPRRRCWFFRKLRRRTIPSLVDRSGNSAPPEDRKSTRLNSSHQIISYAVFCLKKKKKHGYHLYRDSWST